MNNKIIFCDTCVEDVSGEKLEHCKYLRHELLENPLEKVQDEKQSEEEQKNTSEKIYHFAKTKIKKIIVSENDSNQVFALIENSEHIETLDLSSTRAKSWLRYSYFVKTQKNHSEDAYANALYLIRAEAVHADAPRETVFNRIAMVGDAIYYDLATSDWKAVKITENLVDTIDLNESCPAFVRTQNQKSQVMPEFGHEGALDELTKLLRIPQADRKIFQIHLIAMFIEAYPVPIMSIIGEHGSIKSTISKSVKQIVDPAGAKTVSLSKNSENLVLSLHNRYVVCFDNVSDIDQEMSNVLCKAVTGDGNSKRKLYTDSDEVIYSYKRKIILNGISPNMEFPDLMDRNITYTTQKVTEEERITEEEFENKFKELLPFVLGTIFRILSKAMSTYDSVKLELKYLPRMADFATWGECIARALGHEPLSFITNYKEVITSHSLEIVGTNPIMTIIDDLLGESVHYESTIIDFYNAVKERAVSSGFDVASKDVNFPRHFNQVKQHIMRLKPDLRTVGIEIDFAYYTKRNGKYKRNTRIIYIDRRINTISNYGENPSMTSLPSLPDEISEQIREIGGSDGGRDELVKPLPALPYLARFTPKEPNGSDDMHGKSTLDVSENTTFFGKIDASNSENVQGETKQP